MQSVLPLKQSEWFDRTQRKDDIVAAGLDDSATNFEFVNQSFFYSRPFPLWFRIDVAAETVSSGFFGDLHTTEKNERMKWANETSGPKQQS